MAIILVLLEKTNRIILVYMLMIKILYCWLRLGMTAMKIDDKK